MAYLIIHMTTAPRPVFNTRVFNPRAPLKARVMPAWLQCVVAWRKAGAYDNRALEPQCTWALVLSGVYHKKMWSREMYDNLTNRKR